MRYSYNTIYLFLTIILFYNESEQKIGVSITVDNYDNFDKNISVPKSNIGNEISYFNMTEDISQ